jgi:hypothetical protein
MANPRIEVEIGAKTDGLIRGVDGAIISLKDLEKESEKLKIALKGATDESQIGNYNAQLSKLQAGMKALKSQGVDPLTKATSNYNGVGVEFSRIIQDAPFGIIGVGNNITRLAETFQHLRSQSTSTGAALKTALSSIISPANLLVLGISAVTTALTLWQMGAFESSESTKSLADAAKEAKEEMEEFRLSLDAVTQARIKGESSASKEIGDLKLLREQAENTNVTQKKRLEAVDALQKQYPETLGNLSKEQILAGDVGMAYEQLTKQIIATSKARAFSDKISENSLELLTLEEKSAQKVQDILEKRDELEKAREDDKLRRQIGAAAGGVGSAATSEATSVQNKLNALIDEQIALVAQRNKINAENLTLETKITEQIGQGATFTKESVEPNKKIKDISKEIEKSTAKRLTDLGEINKLESEFQNLISATQKIVSENEKERAKKLKIATIQEGGIDFSAGFIPTEEIAQLAPQLENLQAEVSPILETLGQAFSGLGNQIANSLNIGNDALKGFVGTLISNTPKIIQAVFQQVAANKKAAVANFAASKIEATGDAIVTGGKAAKALGPLGLALLPVFVGGAVALISKAFGGGGGGGGGSSVGSSVASQSFSGSGVGGLGGGNRDLTGELVVRGTDLVYVLGQSNNKIAKG